MNFGESHPLIKITYFDGMRKQVSLGSVKVFLNSCIPGLNPLILRPLNNSSRLWQPDNLDKVWHVPDKIIVDPLLIQNQDYIDLGNIQIIKFLIKESSVVLKSARSQILNGRKDVLLQMVCVF